MELKYIIEICVAIDIAILGIAYPIIVDKISNIGHKFSSNYLANAFENEFPQTKLFGIFPGRSMETPDIVYHPRRVKVTIAGRTKVTHPRRAKVTHL